MWHYDDEVTSNFFYTYQIFNTAPGQWKKSGQNEAIVMTQDCPKFIGSTVTCGSQSVNSFLKQLSYLFLLIKSFLKGRLYIISSI